MFRPPPQWSPKLMPAVNFQVGLPSLGVKVNPLNMGVSMNMGPPAVHVTNVNNPYNNPSNNPYNNETNVRMNVSHAPMMEMQIQAPMATTHLHGNMAPMSPTSPYSPTRPGVQTGVAVGGAETNVTIRPF